MIAMTHVGYVAAGWGISLTGLGLYAFRTVRRERSLTREIPPEDRRWT